MKITLPRKVTMIINNLQLHGYEAFAVGGCVRDSILARRPSDRLRREPEVIPSPHFP